MHGTLKKENSVEIGQDNHNKSIMTLPDGLYCIPVERDIERYQLFQMPGLLTQVTQ